MSVSNYFELKQHIGHKLQCVGYGNANVSIECLDCNEVLLSHDNKPCPFGGDITNNCESCAYVADYYFDGENCVRRKFEEEQQMKKNKTVVEHQHNINDTVYIMVNKPMPIPASPEEMLDGELVASEPLKVSKILCEIEDWCVGINYVLVGLDGEEIPGEYDEANVFKTQEEAQKVADELNKIPF